MKRYPDHLVVQARRLATTGLNYSEIGKHLNIGKATISVWCRGIYSSKRSMSLFKFNESKRNEILKSECGFLSTFSFDKNINKLICAILYGCEGSKYPASSRLMMTNSDEGLIKTFVNLMRSSFPLDENKWRIHLQVHTDQNYFKLVEFWSELLNIPAKQFIKPTITTPNGKKHRNVYNGTCTVRYYDFKLQLKLIGIFNEIMRKSSVIT